MTKQLSKQERQRQLIQACMASCAERGYHGTRVDDIAAVAGLSKGAIYHHFPGGKDAVFLAALEEIIDSLAQLFRDTSPDEPAAAALRRIFEQNLLGVEQMQASMPGLVEFYLLAMRKPDYRQHFVAHYEGFIAAGTALVARGVREGDFDASIDPGATVRSFFLAIDGLMIVLISLHQYEQLVPDTRVLVDLMFRALGAREGSP